MSYREYLAMVLLVILIFPSMVNNSSYSTVEISGIKGRSGTRADEEPPSLVGDNTPGAGTTGEEFTFSANFTDNVSVASAWVNYTYNDTYFSNLSMNNIAGEMWNRTITININATYINYTFFYQDGTNNTNTTTVRTVEVIDNIRPIADAGEDLETPQGDNFYVDGSGSSDNVGIINYTWTWRCGGCGSVHFAYGEAPEISGDIGNLTLNLNVTDAYGNWDNDTMNMTVTDVVPPISNAGDDIVIDQYETAYFNGNKSGDSFGIVNYTWSFFLNDTSVNLYGMYANFTFDLAGGYQVTLTVADAAGNTAPWCSDSILVTVRDITSPSANAGEDLEIAQHETVYFNANSSSDNIFILHHTWSFFDDGELSLSGIAPNYTFHNAGEFQITLNVSDGSGNWAHDILIVTVRDTTAPMANAGGDRTKINWGELVVLNGSGSQDNVGIANYTWSFVYNDTLRYLYGEEISFRFFSLGTYTVHLNVTDVEGNAGEDNCIIEVVDKIPPIADAGPDIVVGAGDTVVLDANGTTDHSLISSYIWWFIYNRTTKTLKGSRINFTFDIIDIYEIVLIVRDEWGNTATDKIIIEVRDATPPVAEAGADQEKLLGNTIHFYGDGWDNVGIMNYSWKFTYNNSEVILEGKMTTFVFEIADNYSVTLTVSDEAGNTAEDMLWVNVSVLPEDDDDTDDDNNDDENDDGLTENGENRTDGKDSFFTSTHVLMAMGALLILFILGVGIAMRSKRRVGEPGDKPGEKEGENFGEVPKSEGEGAIEVDDGADADHEKMTETEDEEGKEMDDKEDGKKDEEGGEMDDEEDGKKDEEGGEMDDEEDGKKDGEGGDTGIDVEIDVDDEPVEEISKDDLELEGIGEDLICISCGKKVMSSDSNCPQCGEDLDLDL